MSNLQEKNLNASLSSGYTSEGLQKKGSHGSTFMASFNLNSTTTARLEQSPDGVHYNEIPDSEAEIAAGVSEQMWNEKMLPEGSFIRLSVDAVSGTLVSIKMLS